MNNKAIVTAWHNSTQPVAQNEQVHNGDLHFSSKTVEDVETFDF